MDLLPPPRRVLTAIDTEGQSYIAEDGPSPAEFVLPGSVYRSSNIWRTHAAPSDIAAPDDIFEHRGVLPPEHGTVIRVIDMPPIGDATPEQRAAMVKAVFDALYPDARHQEGNDRSAGMHTTDTIDYAIVLQGEVVAVMDRDETTLRAGDILIQRGTAHSWENRSATPCRIVFVLIAAKR
ncbi:cupin domain-containing protein [Sphingomonas panacisoli]|uniref:Cupin domain-containing protein n=1 Tax=Sphingomonas panacisoli TaxID=1813879 RepID=A0A5B8LH99_9SPHN|nr:cupin domain-containing protein [Sphingomonas panacisoli]QDZ07229.1 cupin domain-containing protein [Sphingomonas panacisoli]